MPFIKDREIRYYNYSISDWIEALDDNATKLSIGQKEQGAFFLEVDYLKIPVFVYENDAGNLMHLIPQMAQRSCVWTCLSMQILDYCASENITDINASHIFRNISEGNLHDLDKSIPALKYIFGDRAEIFYADRMTLASTERKLRRGSLCLSVSDPNIGGHVICAHSYNRENGLVRIKDPRHGWDITTSIRTLYSRRKLEVSPVLEIRKPWQSK